MDNKFWKKVKIEEMDKLKKNETWDLVELLGGTKAIGRKSVVKKKLNEGKVKQYKAHLVVRDIYGWKVLAHTIFIWRKK